MGGGGAQGPCVLFCHCESPIIAWGPASLPQVLIGDVEDAICLHAFYYAIWKRYGALPERYNWQLQAPDVLFYPLRPELVESTYLLYQVLPGGPGQSVPRECLLSGGEPSSFTVTVGVTASPEPGEHGASAVVPQDREGVCGHAHV